MSKQTVVFFAPYAGIWPHAYPEALVASALKQAGENIVYAACDGMFADGCVVMTAHRLTPSSPKAQREAICQMCRKRRDVLVAGVGATMVKLDDFLPLADRERIANVASTVEPEQIEVEAGVTVRLFKGATQTTVTEADGFPSQFVPVDALAVTTPPVYK